MVLQHCVKAYMEREKLSTRRLASRIGIGHTVLFRFVNGREIRSEKLQSIIRWLLCS